MHFCQVGNAPRHCGRTATTKAIRSFDSPHVCVCACRRLEEAVRWSAAVQKALLGMNWPEALLQWGDCQPIKDPDTGALLWRGLRVRMGMSWGQPSYKKPLNTGAQPVPADLLWCKHSEATSQLCLGLAQAVNDTACCVLLSARFHASCVYNVRPGTERCHCTAHCLLCLCVLCFAVGTLLQSLCRCSWSLSGCQCVCHCRAR